jgi:hypothetical protein
MRNRSYAVSQMADQHLIYKETHLNANNRILISQLANQNDLLSDKLNTYLKTSIALYILLTVSSIPI